MLTCPKCEKEFKEVFHEAQYEYLKTFPVVRYEEKRYSTEKTKIVESEKVLQKMLCPTCLISNLQESHASMSSKLQGRIQKIEEMTEENQQLQERIAMLEQVNSSFMTNLQDEIERLNKFTSRTERQQAQLSTLQDFHDAIAHLKADKTNEAVLQEV